MVVPSPLCANLAAEPAILKCTFDACFPAVVCARFHARVSGGPRVGLQSSRGTVQLIVAGWRRAASLLVRTSHYEQPHPRPGTPGQCLGAAGCARFRKVPFPFFHFILFIFFPPLVSHNGVNFIAGCI